MDVGVGVGVEEEVGAVVHAVCVLHGFEEGDLAAANTFLTQLQQQHTHTHTHRCLWVCLRGLQMHMQHPHQHQHQQPSHMPVVCFTMATMLRHSLTRAVDALGEDLSLHLFAEIMNLLSAVDQSSSPLSIQLCLCVGTILATIQQGPCQWLTDTSEYASLSDDCKLQLINTLPGCGLWLTTQEIFSMLKHIIDLGQGGSSQSQMQTLLSCLVAWCELPTEGATEISLYTAAEQFPDVLTLALNILCLNTPFVTESVLSEESPMDRSSSLPLRTLFSSLDLLCALLAYDVQYDSPARVQLLTYLDQATRGLDHLLRLAPRSTSPVDEDIFGRKIAMVGIEILRHTSEDICSGRWEGGSILLQLLLDLMLSNDLLVTEIILVEDTWEAIIFAAAAKSVDIDGFGGFSMDSVLETLIQRLLTRCMYPVDWVGWGDSVEMEEMDFNKFRLVHARSMLLTITSSCREKVARLILTCVERASTWAEAEVSLFGFYSVGSELVRANMVGTSIGETVWRLVEYALDFVTSELYPAPLKATAFLCLGEVQLCLSQRPSALVTAFDQALLGTADSDTSVSDAAAMALARMSFSSKTMLFSPEMCAKCVSQAQLASSSLSREGRARMFEGIVRVCAAGISTAEGVQACFALLDLCLQKLASVTVLLTEARVSVHTPAFAPLSPIGASLSPSRTLAYPLSPLRQICLTDDVCQQLRDEADLLLCVSRVLTPHLHPPRRIPGGRETSYVIPHEQLGEYAAGFVTRLWETCGALVSLIDTITRTDGMGEKMELAIDSVCLLIRCLVDVFKDYSACVWSLIAEGLVHIFMCSNCCSCSPINTAVSFAAQVTMGHKDPRSSSNVMASMMASFTAGLKRVASQVDARTSPVFGSFLCLCKVVATYDLDLFLSMPSLSETISLAAYLLPSQVSETASQSVELLSLLLFKMRKGSARDQELLADVVQSIAPDLIFYILVGISEETPVSIVPRVADVLAPILHQKHLRPNLCRWMNAALATGELQRLVLAIEKAGGSREDFVSSVTAVQDPYAQASSTDVQAINDLRQILIRAMTLSRGAHGEGVDLAQLAMTEAYG